MNMLIAFYFKHITFRVLLCLIVFTFFSCGPSGTNPKDKNAAHERLCKETFTKLRDMFPYPILNENFKTLKKVTSSKVYLDFLKQAYPTGKPFQTLDEFVEAALPSDGRYQNFLNTHLETPTDADLRGIHQLALIYRRSNIMMLHETMQAELTKKPLDLQAAMMEKTLATSKKPVSDWWYSSELSKKEEAQMLSFFLGFDYLVTETEKTDTDWIQAQFEKHGQANGMLWIAIRKPILTGEILTNFSSTDLFLAWVSQKFILQRLSAFKEISEDK